MEDHENEGISLNGSIDNEDIKDTSQIEVGLSKLQNTLSMLEKNDANSDIAVKALKDNSDMQAKHDNHEKNLRAKSKKNREVSELEENKIISARLRSESGRVYSSGLVVGTQNITSVLEDLSEIQEVTKEVNMPVRKQQPCSDSECCKNTAKIVNMIADLQHTVNAIKLSTETQTMVGAGNAGNIRRVEDMVNDNTAEIKALDEEMTDYKFQLKLLTNIVIRQDHQINTLTKKINDAQQREMYPNLVISGIAEKTNENPLQVYNTFIQNQLEIQELIPAHRAYRIGSGVARPLIVELRDPSNAKPKIYKNAGKLKNKRNETGGRFFISDHLPENYNEDRRRLNDLISENKKKDTAEQLKMSAKKGRLLIDDQPYQKAIHSPSVKEVMKPDAAMRELADEIDMVKGKDKTTDGSTFVSYVAAVQDHKDIQAAYCKVRTKFADATHVVCAYRLAGSNFPSLQDYNDDGEYGAGRIILNVLKEEKLMNVVLFMIRYHGGRNLGPARFDIFKGMARSAIANLRQKIKDEELLQQQKTAEQERQHQEYIRQQTENPAFPTEGHEWHSAHENWETSTKKDD